VNAFLSPLRDNIMRRNFIEVDVLRDLRELTPKDAVLLGDLDRLLVDPLWIQDTNRFWVPFSMRDCEWGRGDFPFKDLMTRRHYEPVEGHETWSPYTRRDGSINTDTEKKVLDLIASGRPVYFVDYSYSYFLNKEKDIEMWPIRVDALRSQWALVQPVASVGRPWFHLYRLHNERYRILTYEANSLLTLDHRQEALDKFQEVVAEIQNVWNTSPRDEDGNEFLCYAYLMRGDLGSAEREGAVGLVHFPSSMRLAYLMASVYYKKNDMQTASKFPILVKDKTKFNEDRLLVHLLHEAEGPKLSFEEIIETGDKQRVAQFLQKVIDRCPGCPEAWSSLGYLLQMAGKTKAACVAFNNASLLAPNEYFYFENYWHFRAWIFALLSEKQPVEAYSILEKGLEEFDRPATLLLLAASLGNSLKRLPPEQVIGMLQEASEQEQPPASKVQAYLALGDNLLSLDRKREAGVAFERALKIEPDSEKARSGLARSKGD